MFGFSERGDSELKLIRIDWDGDIGFPVWDGNRMSHHDEGVGFTIDAGGWRLCVSVTAEDRQRYPDTPMIWCEDDPLSFVWIMHGALDVYFSPAYGGYLMSRSSDQATVVCVNFKTPDLTRDCISSLRQFYPNVKIILIDNGGCDASLKMARQLGEMYDLTVIENRDNIGHGPALNQGIHLATTPYVFTLDSDTRTEKGGFIEEMIGKFKADASLFALGWLRYTGESGVATPKQELKRGMKYVHPYACMLDREKYLGLSTGFIHSGAPAAALMSVAGEAGYGLEDFPVDEYIWHKVAGTRGCFRGQCKVPTDRKPEKWRHHRI